MQTIEITNVTGSGVYDIYVCDLTLTYCQTIATSVSIPPNYTFVLTGVLSGVSSIIVKIVDVNTGCEKFIPYYCPSPTPTQTPSQTPTQTPSTCLCTAINNVYGTSYSFTYINCSDIVVYESCPALTTLFICSKSVTYSDPNLSVTILGPCIGNVCPDIYITPTPTPSITPSVTPTQTVPSKKIFQSGDNFIFMFGDYYIFENQ